MKSALDFESSYCLNLKNAYYGNQELSSLYFPLLRNLLKHRCTDDECYLSRYWNETNQNGMSSGDFTAYLGTSLYLLFPIFLFLILLFFIIGFIFCIYCNCCFFCCFSYDAKLRSDAFFIRLIAVCVASVLIYLGLSLFIQISFESFRLYTEFTLCQLSSVNIFQFLSGVNITDINNNNRPDPSIDWGGLLYLNNSFMGYYKEVLELRSTVANEIYLRETDYVADFYNRINNGLNNYTEYIRTNPFELRERNADVPEFDLTYKCFQCINDTMLNLTVLEFNSNFVSWHKKMDKYRKTIYDLFLDDNGWLEGTQKDHLQTKVELRKVAYETIKFYNNVIQYYDDVQTAQSAARVIDYVSLSLICLGLLLTIIGYRFIKLCKI
jgi:hypothetical protein